MTATLVDAGTKVPTARNPVRADIQSFRALAVGLVVLNHLWPGDLTGGYIGVDIFFVISGFLITSHLKREIDLTGGVKLARFWARRAKRLLPAAILVLIASAAIAAWVLPVTSERAAYTEIGAAGAYALNWVLAANSVDYFAHTALSPVTHYWSLSVEEQFYIVWPLLIVAGLLLTRTRSARVRHFTMLGTLALVFVASLAWAVWSVSTQPDAAYFQTTGRAWEFAAGGLLAFLPPSRWRSLTAKTWSSWALWGVVLASAFFYGPATGFPGPAALVPVAAIMALIWIGDGGSRLSPQRVFAVGPIQAVGNISYSLYLWHWPLIVAATFLVGDLSGPVKVGILALALALAWLTKRYVEDTVRFARGPVLGKSKWVLIAAAATVAIILGGTTAAASNIDNRSRAIADQLYEQALDPSVCFGAQAAFHDGCSDSHHLENADAALTDWDAQNYTVSNGSWCQQSRGAAEVAKCTFGVPEGDQLVNVALIGDSHASMWAAAIDSIDDLYGLRVTTYLALGCAALDDPSIAIAFDTNAQHIEACTAWRENAIAEVEQSPDIDIVVTTSVDRAYFTTADSSVEDTGDGYVRAWQRWLDSGKTVVVLNDVPMLPTPVPECLATSHTDDDPCSMASDTATRVGPLAKAAKQIDNPRFHFVDQWDVFCNSERCSSVIGGIPAYVDSNHLAAPFARSFADKLIPAEFITDAARSAEPSK